MIPKGTYPNTFYRVSLKAIIRNSKGEVLVVKEEGGDWSLPGGGMDHGETDEQALARELYEEALITAPFHYTPVGTWPRFLEHKNAWLLWIVYEVEFDGDPTYGKGSDGDDVAFIDPKVFKDSRVLTHQLIYRWCVERYCPAESVLEGSSRAARKAG